MVHRRTRHRPGDVRPRRPEAQIADRRCGVGNAQELVDRTGALADHYTAIRSCGRIGVPGRLCGGARRHAA
jgi:hypothetical protein